MQPEMKYIYTVYQCGSFSKAAEKLFLTQPALSISVQKVEHEVGMPLFNRDKKPLELTEAGMIYIQKIEQIQHLEQELAMQLNDLTDLKTGHLHSKNPRLHTDEVLIALSICAATDETVKEAIDQLQNLAGTEFHSSVILSQVDMNVLRKLGINVTCEPNYESQKLYHR